MIIDKTKKNLKGVIVIGGHVQGLGITRIFGKEGIPVLLLDHTTTNLTKHSKYCKKFIQFRKGELHDILISLGQQNKYKDWLLMPTNDGGVEVAGMYKQELQKYFKVTTADVDVLDYFFNKRNTYNLAEELDVPIPITWMPNSWNELSQLDVAYPCIIKPAIMYTFYANTKKKVFVCNDKAELKENYEKALKLIPPEEIIIQDIVPGNSEHQYSVCFMYNKNEPLVTLSVRRARQHPPDFGNATTYAETVDIPEIVARAAKILKRVGFIGVCEVEFKYDTRDKTYKFLEVNPRTWKWHSIAEKSKTPLLMSLYHYHYKLSPIIKNNQENAAFRHIVTDIPSIIKMKLLGIKLTKTRKNVKYAVWDLKDWKPTFFEMIYVPYFIINR